MISSVDQLKNILDKNSINYSAIYLFGSRVYGTSSEKSDWDYIVVSNYKRDYNVGLVDTGLDEKDYIPLETEEEFFQKLLDHDIKALECIYSDEKYKIETAEWKDQLKKWKLDLAKLRIGVSSKSSNSWVKAKKKIEVENDLYIGLKSLFHSLRMLDFGIQVAQYGKINDFTSSNHYWEQIQTESSWDTLKLKYQPIYNALKTEFRKKTT